MTATTRTSSTAAGIAVTSDERWTSYAATVLTICILGWAFDIYEATIMQLVTPILIKEWGITPAIMGTVTTISRWVGLIGTFVFPALADLYGRKPALIWSILGYSIFTGLTGFSIGWVSLLIFSSLTRIALAGENPVGMLLVTETAPKKWRATALGGLVGGYPLGYLLCSLAALVVVPLRGWRALYFLGILPALLVLWVRLGINESPRYERVTAQMVKERLKKRLDILSPFRSYPRESVTATLIYFLYLFTWLGWSAWMPFYLANERHLGFPTMATYLSIWMFCAIFAYWMCGWLCDLFGRRWVIPAFTAPAAVLLVAMGHIDRPTSLFWVGFWYRPRLHVRDIPDANPRHRRRRDLRYRPRLCLAGADDHGVDCNRSFGCRRPASSRFVILAARSALSLVRARCDTQGTRRLRRRESCLKTNT